jgi:PII-like signaling protein
MESRFTSRLSSRRANEGLPGQLYCADRWGLDIRAVSVQLKFRASQKDLPVVVEIVDTKEKITAFLSLLDGMVKGGLVTLKEIQVVRYGPGQNKLS